MPDSISYDTATLVQVVPNLKTSQNFLLDMFYKNIVEFDSEEVAIDVDIGKRRMAPFVSPLVAGRMVESRRIQTNKLKPAYIKDLRAPDLRKPVRRAIGERIGGELTGAKREQANLVFEMADQVDMVNRRLEWMAAQGLLTGTCPVEGEGYNPVVIDFGRDAALTISLAGASQWGATLNAEGYDDRIGDNITAWSALVLQKSGAVCTDIVFTNASWQAFKKGRDVRGAILFPSLNANGNIVNPGAKVEKGGTYMGRWGNFDLWLYNDWYVDENDVEQPMLPDGSLIMSGPQLMGTRAFGQILDPEFSYAPMAYAPKTWVEKNPAQRIIMMQSAPIIIPTRINAALAATVCAPLRTS